MPNFFIDRPIFAWVIAIIIMLAGGRCDPQAAGRAISNDCATGDCHHGRLSRSGLRKTVQNTVTQVNRTEHERYRQT